MKNSIVSYCIVVCLVSCSMNAMERAIESATYLVAIGHIMAIAAEAFEVDERPGEESQQCPEVLSTTWSNLLEYFSINDDSQENILDQIRKKSEAIGAHLDELEEKIARLEKEVNKPKPTDIASEDEHSGDEIKRSSPQKNEGKFNRTVLH